MTVPAGAPRHAAKAREVVVSLVDVVLRAGTLTILDGVSLQARAGRLIALSGRSGSGKSALCHLVAGVTEPTSGSVQVLGGPAHPARAWRDVTLLPQRLALVPELTIAENITWPCVLADREPPLNVLAGLALDSLADRPARSASIGEQQRAGLARALSIQPIVAVLDEPTGHQDDTNVELVITALMEAASAGTCVMVATHDDRVLDACDDVIQLDGGRRMG